jgi:hypothetical protein
MSRGLPLDRLADRCVRTSDGCLLWQGSTHAGYGVVVRRGRRLRLHRVVVELADGRPIPPGMIVRHTCPAGPQRACQERSHLALGSQADNVHDMVALGRQARGERHGLHRLTEGAVRAIRGRRADGACYTDLARAFGVTKSTARRAVVGGAWEWLS